EYPLTSGRLKTLRRQGLFAEGSSGRGRLVQALERPVRDLATDHALEQGDMAGHHVLQRETCLRGLPARRPVDGADLLQRDSEGFLADPEMARDAVVDDLRGGAPRRRDDRRARCERLD